MKNKCLELLVAEHKTILRAIDVLCVVGRQTSDGQKLNREDINGLLEFFRVFADELHQGKEESALFPAFTAACERSEIEPVRHMLFEHETDRSLTEGLEDALLTSNTAEFVDYAARLSEMLRTHIYKEDNILFDMMDKGLSSEADAHVLHDFQAFDRDFTDRGHDKLLHRLRMLEWKYLRKVA